MIEFKRRAALRAIFGTAAASVFATGFARRGHAATHTVTIRNFAFEPATLTVAAGDTVTFTNADGAPHTATRIFGSLRYRAPDHRAEQGVSGSPERARMTISVRSIPA